MLRISMMPTAKMKLSGNQRVMNESGTVLLYEFQFSHYIHLSFLLHARRLELSQRVHIHIWSMSVVSGDQRTLLRYSSNRMQILSYPCPLPNQTEGAATDTTYSSPRNEMSHSVTISFVVSINPISILMKTST